MTEDRMPRSSIDAILIVRVVSNYQSAGAVFQKLRGKGKKGGLTAFLFPPLRLSFASLTLLPPTPSSVLYSLSQKGPPSSSLRILVLVHKRIGCSGSAPTILLVLLLAAKSYEKQGGERGERGRGREGFGIEVEPLSHTKLCMPTAHGGSLCVSVENRLS